MNIQIGYNGDAKRDDLLRILRSNRAVVIFTKVNGEERAMRCTLIPEMLPDRKKYDVEFPDGTQARFPAMFEGYHTEETGTIAVWDLEKNDWRAFRVDSVKEILYRTHV